MAVDLRSVAHKTWRTLASIETGVVLLILVVILSAVGTIVLQRPVTRPEEMERAYSPQVLRLLDAAGLTDLFHSWWFLGLVCLVSFAIAAASVDRFPNRWRYFARPCKYPDGSLRRAMQMQKTLALAGREGYGEGGGEAGLAAAQRALQSRGYNPERVAAKGRPGIFAERHRISELAVYVVHASLLLIFFGTLVDGLWGWRGTLSLDEGQVANQVVTRDGRVRALPFSIRCDAAGQENYPDGTPRKLWSRLAVVEGGRDVLRKEIVVNDPLIYGGVRIYESSYGGSGKVESLTLAASPQGGSGPEREIGLALNEAAALDAETMVRFAGFLSDAATPGQQGQGKASELASPAVHLVVTAGKPGRDFDLWLPPGSEAGSNPQGPWRFRVTGLKAAHSTGLEVSHEPGQWGVWSGVILMGFGLVFEFYLVHTRFWVVPVRDPRTGKPALWIGGSANRNRERFEERFNDLAALIEKELGPATGSVPEEATRFGR